MKVYHVKTTVPKEVNDSEEFKRIIRVNIDLAFKKYNGFSVEKGVYFCYHSTFNDDIENENIFFFCDEYFFSEIKSTLEYIVNKFGGFEYGVEDITLDVKLERYDDEFFEKLFYSEDSDINNKFNFGVVVCNCWVSHFDLGLRHMVRRKVCHSDVFADVLEVEGRHGSILFLFFEF